MWHWFWNWKPKNALVCVLGGQYDSNQPELDGNACVAATKPSNPMTVCISTTNHVPQPYNEPNLLLFRADGAQQTGTLQKFSRLHLNWNRVLKHLPLTFFPWTVEYNTVRLIPDRLFQHFPDLIVYIRNLHELRRIIRLSRHYKLPISIRSGGHIREYFSIQHPLVLDTSALSDMKVVQQSEDCFLLSVGAGVRIGPVYDMLANQNLILPAGTCPSVGLAGLVTGGGMGFSMRQFGLLCDNLEEAVITLADGTANKVTAHSSSRFHKDLWFAIRGAGGGNFGVISNMTFRVHKVDTISVFQIECSLDHAADALDVFQYWGPDTDTRLTSEFDMTPTTVSIQGSFFGTATDLELLIQPLLIIPTARIGFLRPSTVREHYTLYANNERFLQNPFWWNRNVYIDGILPRKGVETFVEQMKSSKTRHIPGTQSMLLWALKGNISNASEPNTSSYYPRNARMWWLLNAGFKMQQEEDAVLRYVREFFAQVQPYVGQGNVYCNFPNLDLTKDGQYLTSYWGTHVKRLRKIKTKVDPHNFWHFTQSIPLSREDHKQTNIL